MTKGERVEGDGGGRGTEVTNCMDRESTTATELPAA